jgi:hypothetical protein
MAVLIMGADRPLMGADRPLMGADRPLIPLSAFMT